MLQVEINMQVKKEMKHLVKFYIYIRSRLVKRKSTRRRQEGKRADNYLKTEATTLLVKSVEEDEPTGNKELFENEDGIEY